MKESLHRDEKGPKGPEGPQGCGGCDCRNGGSARCRDRMAKAFRKCWCPDDGTAWVGIEK